MFLRLEFPDVHSDGFLAMTLYLFRGSGPAGVMYQ